MMLQILQFTRTVVDVANAIEYVNIGGIMIFRPLLLSLGCALDERL